jgi:hypothetical protein
MKECFMHKLFSKISSLHPDNNQSWENKLFLTLDIDWCHDDILLNAIDLLEAANVSATWFVTHNTPILEKLRSNPNFELGIHPNFNLLLEGNSKKAKNAEEVIDQLLKIVPEAKSVRSHSMTQNSHILNLFNEKGLTHDCNHFIPEQAGIELKPWNHWNGIIKVPYFWEDDVTFIAEKKSEVEKLTSRKGLIVFNFHPIHIFLNTERLDRYEKARSHFNQPNILFNHRNNEFYGTRNFLLDLIKSYLNFGFQA